MKGWTYRPRNPILADRKQPHIFANPYPNLLGEHLFLHKLLKLFVFLKEQSALIQNGPTSPKLQHSSVLFQVESLREAPTKCLSNRRSLPSCLRSAELPAAFRQLHQLDSGEVGVGSVKTPIKSCELFQPTVSLLVGTGVK